MTVHDATESYIALKRSLGMVFNAEARVLRSFTRTVGGICLEKVSREACKSFCRGTGPPTTWWERKHYTLRSFFIHMVARGHLATSPMPEAIPRISRSFVPYIYTTDELRSLLDATAILDDSRWPMQAFTFRTLVLVLCGAGLRPGEGLRLRCCDVDLHGRLLAIWDTKFFKSRLVPIGADLLNALGAYREGRERLPMPAGNSSAFFTVHTGKAISLRKLESVFVRLREQAGIRRPGGSRRQPRLHDLRHAFAVHRLIAWYREGADVQACLPLLATYLGHVNVSGTQAYLTMTPEPLAEASKRFESYFGIAGEVHDA